MTWKPRPPFSGSTVAGVFTPSSGVPGNRLGLLLRAFVPFQLQTSNTEGGDLLFPSQARSREEPRQRQEFPILGVIPAPDPGLPSTLPTTQALGSWVVPDV